MSLTAAVIDLGFGDSGKGVVVDNLCDYSKNLREKRRVVVRFSGGHQCGHTVMPDENRKHIFSSFGSGTFHGCETFFTEDTCMYLPAMINEAKILKEKFDIFPSLILHPRVMMTTPYDVAYNRAKETLISKHGSCGTGVGATMKRCIETPFKTFAIDVAYPKFLFERLDAVVAYYHSLVKHNEEFKDLFDREVELLMPDFVDAIRQGCQMFTYANQPDFTNTDVVFEGSQGIMLDMDHGMFPNVTYANTTSKNVWKKCDEWGLSLDSIYYVARCYTTRHGAGWIPNDRALSSPLINNGEEINKYNLWQEEFRINEFDYNMINHALRIDKSYHHSDHCWNNLVITCVDQRPDFEIDYDMIKGIDRFYTNDSPLRGHLKYE